MGTTADKLTYLNNTKSLLKDRLNSLGATITSSTTFRNYLTWLDTFYEDVSNKTDISVNGVVGRTSQETTSISGGDEYDSPSPDYPQPINNLSGDVSYKVSGKNLWDYRAVPRSDNLTLHGITYVINDDGSITLNGTSTGQYIGLIYDITLPAGTYYIGGCPDGGSSQGYNVCVSWGNGTHIIVAPSKNAMQSFTLTEETTIQFWAVRIGGNTVTFNNTVFYPMLYTVNDNNYEPYIEPQTFTIPLGDIELCEVGTGTYKKNDKIYSSNGKFYLEKNIDKTIFNGTEQGWWVQANEFRCYLKDALNNSGLICNYFKNGWSGNHTSNIYYREYIAFRYTELNDDLDDWKNWLSTHNTIVYYPLITPTTTEITASNYPELYVALKEIQDYLTSYKINKEFILGYSSPNIEY